MNWKSLLALNYDLLLQYPVHRLAGNRKITRPLNDKTDVAIISEETLLNEALDLIESLAVANDSLNDFQKKQQERLQKLLPLLLYRYRPETSVNSSSGNSKSNNSAEPMSIVRDQQTFNILAFNLRPFNSGLRFENWPIGRTKELAITTEPLDGQSEDEDVKIHYVVEPLDKKAWLHSKVSRDGTVFNVVELYKNTDRYFGKHMLRMRALRKARFRSVERELRHFRKLLFETQFYRDQSVEQKWDWLWQDSLSAFHYDDSSDLHRQRKLHMVANLLALFQPRDIDQAVEQFIALNSVIKYAFVCEKQCIDLLEQLLRATVYDKKIASNKNCVLKAIVNSLGNLTTMPSTSVRAATLYLFCAIRSRFSDAFCLPDNDLKVIFNTFYRIVASVESLLDTGDGKTLSYLSVVQLWQLARKVIDFMRTNVVDLDIESIDFVRQFSAHVGTNFEAPIDFETSLQSALRSNYSE